MSICCCPGCTQFSDNFDRLRPCGYTSYYEPQACQSAPPCYCEGSQECAENDFCPNPVINPVKADGTGGNTQTPVWDVESGEWWIIPITFPQPNPSTSGALAEVTGSGLVGCNVGWYAKGNTITLKSLLETPRRKIRIHLMRVTQLVMPDCHNHDSLIAEIYVGNWRGSEKSYIRLLSHACGVETELYKLEFLETADMTERLISFVYVEQDGVVCLTVQSNGTVPAMIRQYGVSSPGGHKFAIENASGSYGGSPIALIVDDVVYGGVYRYPNQSSLATETVCGGCMCRCTWTDSQSVSHYHYIRPTLSVHITGGCCVPVCINPCDYSACVDEIDITVTLTLIEMGPAEDTWAMLDGSGNETGEFSMCGKRYRIRFMCTGETGGYFRLWRYNTGTSTWDMFPAGIFGSVTFSCHPFSVAQPVSMTRAYFTDCCAACGGAMGCETHGTLYLEATDP